MKKIHRFNQALSQTLGRSEKSDVLGEELTCVDQRVAAMVKSLEHTKKKLIESLRSLKASSSREDGNLDKRRKGLEEHKLSQSLTNDAKTIESTFEHGLLSDVMTVSGDALGEIVDEIVQYEMQVEQHVLEKLTKFHEDLRSINNQKEKLKKLVLDMDSARTRLNAAQGRGERTNEIQDELDNAQMKVENCKDSLACDLYTLASKEVDMAVLFKVLLQIQMDFHRTALKRLEAAEPLVVGKIDTYSRRPVYGCPLEDHLRYSDSEIAIVLEVCCSALCELGLRDEGLFRISSNAIKLRKLKASFDAGEIDLSDFERDPHSIAGALKCYLRELPDSLMTNNLYTDWMNAVSNPNSENQLPALKAVIEKLPKCNYANLRYLVKFLSKLASNQQYTKMSSQNLAIVMAPNMIWNTVGKDGFGLNNVHGTLVETLISNANYFFPGEIRFTSPHITAIVDKTGGFLENGTLTRAVALTVNVAKACAEDFGDIGDGQLSPSKGSSRRPKQPAPPPPPPPSGVNKAKSPKAEFGQRGPQRVAGKAFNDSVFESSASALLDLSLSNNEDEDEFSFSPIDADENKRKPLPPRPPGPSVQQPMEAPATARTESTAPSQRGGLGHRKTNSLDRPLRPPPRLATNSETIMNKSIERQRNGSSKTRQFPTEDELDELLLGGFSESGQSTKPKQEPTSSVGTTVTSNSNTLPRPHQPQRPPAPSKTGGGGSDAQRGSMVHTKLDGRTMVHIPPSDESEDDEPVVRSLDNEHIYYDVPSCKKDFSPSSRQIGQSADGGVALLSVTKIPDAHPPVMTRTSPLLKSPTGADKQCVANSAGDTQSVAERRESLMKLFAGDQQAGQNSGTVPMRPRPPVPSKPRSGDFSEKDIVRL